ncbi:hypothetical protein NXS19_013448 [Fusarium pseudograminearum]|nr:hypothetical protein NXS19_013448 [Fusarium pseudograminearum]
MGFRRLENPSSSIRFVFEMRDGKGSIAMCMSPAQIGYELPKRRISLQGVNQPVKSQKAVPKSQQGERVMVVNFRACLLAERHPQAKLHSTYGLDGHWV